MSASLDSWVKTAQIAQGFSTPVIAGLAAVITFRIQRRQAKTQEQQAKTQHLQHRLALMERRMKVFNATMDLIVLVLRESRVESMELPFKLLRETKEHHLLFDSEIGEYIQELYKKAVRLHTIHQMSGTQGIIRPADVPLHAEIIEWFNLQIRVAEQKFLKYIDFREP